MKKTILLVLILFFLPLYSQQSFTFQADTLFKYGPPGTFFSFETKFINNTTDALTIQVIRTANQIPANWSSSLCVGITCFPPWVDSVLVSLSPAGEEIMLVDILPDLTAPGYGSVRVLAYEVSNPADSVSAEFTASTDPTGITTVPGMLTGTFRLFPNYPNPFNPETKIPFEIAGNGREATRLQIFNILGQRVSTLISEPLAPGLYEAVWDGSDDRGNPVGSGVYFYQLTAAGKQLTGKMTLVR